MTDWLAVQHTAQVIKRACDVDVAYIDMPVAVGMRRLVEAFAFGSPLRLASPNHIRGLELTIQPIAVVDCSGKLRTRLCRMPGRGSVEAISTRSM